MNRPAKEINLLTDWKDSGKPTDVIEKNLTTNKNLRWQPLNILREFGEDPVGFCWNFRLLYAECTNNKK